jgi:hypothetical protein
MRFPISKSRGEAVVWDGNVREVNDGRWERRATTVTAPATAGEAARLSGVEGVPHA